MTYIVKIYESVEIKKAAKEIAEKINMKVLHFPQEFFDYSSLEDEEETLTSNIEIRATINDFLVDFIFKISADCWYKESEPNYCHFYAENIEVEGIEEIVTDESKFIDFELSDDEQKELINEINKQLNTK